MAAFMQMPQTMMKTQKMFEPDMPDWLSEELMTGTTIMAVECKDGVVLGADSRTTTGAYIANRVTDKLTRVTDHIYCCRSGSAADTQAISDLVSYHLDFQKIQLGEPPLVKMAANVFRDFCYNYRDQLTAGIICAGWDQRLGGQVYSIPIGGMCVRQPVTIGGSGSSFIYGYVDAHYRPNMAQNDCLEFVANAVSLAMARDGSSGGVIRMAAIDKNGTHRHVLTGQNIPEFYDG